MGGLFVHFRIDRRPQFSSEFHEFGRQRGRLGSAAGHLADVPAGTEVFDRGSDILKGKHAVDYRSQLMCADGGKHALELVAAADGDTLEPDVLHHDRRQVEVGLGAAEHADERDRAADAHGPDRLRERARAANLDHMVDAASRSERACPAAPIRHLVIIDDVAGAKLSQALQAIGRRRR